MYCIYSLANLEQHLAPGQAASPYGILFTQQNIEVLYCTEPVFFKRYGAQDSIPRNEFRQPM
jgi:hypothetical protein